MKDLNIYIIEKLKINKDTHIDKSKEKILDLLYEDIYKCINDWCKFNINKSYNLKKSGRSGINFLFTLSNIPGFNKNDFIDLEKKMESSLKKEFKKGNSNIFCNYGPGSYEITILYQNSKLNENIKEEQ